MSVGSALRDLRRQLLATAAGLLLAATAAAVDNPRGAERSSAAFDAQVRLLEERLAATSGGPASIEAGQALATFLDAEMNRAYAELLAQLEPPARQALVAAQRQWLRFRDAELEFARRQWSMQSSGSSYALSRANHRAALLRARLRDLQALLAEYPPATPR